MSVPEWLAEKLAKWTEQGMTGELSLTYQHGVIQHISEDIKSRPPCGKAVVSGCPQCGGPLVDEDYGERRACGKCKRSWTVHQIAQIARAAAPAERG